MTNRTARELVKAGDAHLKKKNFPAAIEAYSQAVESLQDPVVYHNLGMACYKQNFFPQAAIAYREAIKLNPKCASSHTGLAIACYKQREYPLAMAACDTAIRLDPDFPAAYNTLGLIYHAQEDFLKAIDAFRVAIRLVPGEASPYYNLALSYNTQNSFSEAIQAYSTAIDLHPERYLNNCADFSIAFQLELSHPSEHFIKIVTRPKLWEIPPPLSGDVSSIKTGLLEGIKKIEDPKLKQIALWQSLISSTYLGFVFNIQQGLLVTPSLANKSNRKKVAIELEKEILTHGLILDEVTTEALKKDKALLDELKAHFPEIYKRLPLQQNAVREEEKIAPPVSPLASDLVGFFTRGGIKVCKTIATPDGPIENPEYRGNILRITHCRED